MRIAELIVLSVTAVLSQSCADPDDPDAGSGSGCGVAGDGVDERAFTAERDITEADVEQMLGMGYAATRDALDCEHLCSWAASREGRGMMTMEACVGGVDPMPAADPEDLVGDVACEGTANICQGRRPLGHVEAAGPVRELGAYLARCAHLEAASVVAFRQLAGQLADLGAPAALVQRCADAADDEARHAEAVAALARAHGAEPPAAATEDAPATPLDIALQNAVEGCVHETWAALCAHLKAANAHDPAIRAAYATIAVDETRHAQLAWDLHTWLLTRLDDAERARVEAAQADALARLPAVARAQSAVFPAAIGLPAPDVAGATAERFAAELAA